MQTRIIDLRSDTVTQPTQEMRDAMYRAQVGDDVYGDDPTVNRLETLAAEILGKEAALMISSGTMGNQLALMSQTRRGDEVILSGACHIFEHEVGAAAVLSGVNQRQLTFENGIYDAQMIERAIRPSGDIHLPRTALICVENALANGRVVPLEAMREVWQVAQAHDIPVHLDGARLFNAALKLGVDIKELTQYCSTVSCCCSKGLCAPVGAIFAGDRETVARARKYRKMLGGGLRQSGFLAAPMILALTEMPKRLREDHENARHMAERLHAAKDIAVDLDSVEINMVFFKVDKPNALLDAIPEQLAREGILVNPHESGVFRLVAHKDIRRADCDKAIDALLRAIGD